MRCTVEACDLRDGARPLRLSQRAAAREELEQRRDAARLDDLVLRELVAAGDIGEGRGRVHLPRHVHAVEQREQWRDGAAAGDRRLRLAVGRRELGRRVARLSAGAHQLTKRSGGVNLRLAAVQQIQEERDGPRRLNDGLGALALVGEVADGAGGVDLPVGGDVVAQQPHERLDGARLDHRVLLPGVLRDGGDRRRGKDLRLVTARAQQRDEGGNGACLDDLLLQLPAGGRDGGERRGGVVLPAVGARRQNVDEQLHPSGLYDRSWVGSWVAPAADRTLPRG